MCALFSCTYIKSKIFTLHKHSGSKQIQMLWVARKMGRGKMGKRAAGTERKARMVSTFGADAMIYCLQQKPTTVLFVCWCFCVLDMSPTVEWKVKMLGHIL